MTDGLYRCTLCVFIAYGIKYLHLLYRLFLNSEDQKPTPTVQLPDHGFCALTPRQKLQQKSPTAYTPTTRKRIVTEAIELGDQRSV